ncbi:hypothetical protein K227x_29830 [Rubripirellula lacrimiformis]|uniref:Sialate O-acetylesterase domain-containing protein n=1 Tax=Rubripirellula lacrimiformis TaxID=1930273 RepID=A0A517NBV9_9BACT|nr:sialate O-acetylesterase [Rubripirellula lacrimiformis]QDT04591.1 hypothetical protein K227x_29830 [Rubripirellula lacrimiformis]
MRCTLHRSSVLPAATVLLLSVWTSVVSADVRVPSIFGDHMVVQQEKPVRLWGWADPAEKVMASWNQDGGDQHQATGTADANGRWEIELPAMKASSQPATLTIRGNNAITFNDLLVGEVWLCSGQSNMAWTVASSNDAAKEIAAANFPLIRQIQVARKSDMVPQDDFEGQWAVCSPSTVGAFTAAGYFMARKLHRELGVPIGLVNSSWGGTRVEPWTPPNGFQAVPVLSSIYESIMGRTPGSPSYQQRLSQHISETTSWLDDARKALDANSSAGPSPGFPGQLLPFKSHQDPTMLYNAMIHPIVGYPIRGAIWYQGESNHGEGMLYFEKKKALIGGWRQLWEQGDFPFYYVQIAPYHYGNEDPTILAEFWEAQAAVEQIENTGMVVINDIGNISDIHPTNKQDVGDRLAMLALKNDYGKSDLVASSPQVESLDVLKGELKLNFSSTGGGLKTRDGKAPSHFEIIGSGSGGFQPAIAAVDGDSVTLRCSDVSNPVAYRFAWDKLAEPNLMGATGLPVSACRGGEVPKFVDTLPIDGEYQLVYDLDLAKLGSKIQYDVDRSKETPAFDRIGYLVELQTSDSSDPQQVFVTMDAFTDDVGKIAIPTIESGANFQQSLKGMDVFSSSDAVTSDSGASTGWIEFWPNNYSPANGAKVPGASANSFDFGDDPGPPVDGYGSMQVHHGGNKQTVFAINHWKQGKSADLGIGNSKGENPDWTFSGNAGSYGSKRLRVYVRPSSN